MRRRRSEVRVRLVRDFPSVALMLAFGYMTPRGAGNIVFRVLHSCVTPLYAGKPSPPATGLVSVLHRGNAVEALRFFGRRRRISAETYFGGSVRDEWWPPRRRLSTR